ncbi:N-acylglucosamine 2-epimerase [Pseudonocardia hierapolitana]|uniref:N-acylglucosamine 2-epimerase n=1 Tax=Pseudonocardia hierapolitana TaxID=1128676 RepID=A0A561SSM6_9PSEU|nr:AGE family epimerase/isomerase [Pseudonocardia hierapolitana]TWF77869.1 N-acylglucosamine 2-epimerase [Pseudonocardia hierapolitana]
MRYRDHLVDDVLAWWVANGPDPEHGGVLTCWDNAGTRLVRGDKYTWSQGRWAWLTARVALAAHLLDVDAGWYADQAVRTARFVRDHALLPDGTTAFVTNRAGDEAGPHTSVYADLFAALGFAGAARLHPEGEWGGHAEDLLLRSAAAIEAGSFRSEPYPVPAGHRSFGLPMILVGVGEQVHRATGSAASAAVVREAAQQIEEHHLVGDDVAEMPSAADGLLSRHRTPGHVLEAAWFLHHARDLLAGSALAEPDRLAEIAVHALELGWDGVHGGMLRYVDRDGGEPTGARTDDPYEALVVDTWDTKLWWPHAEALYATALLVPEHHARLHEYVFRTFPEGPGREWTQIRTRDGTPVDKTVALPVKDPFHIARALLMLVELEGEG